MKKSSKLITILCIILCFAALIFMLVSAVFAVSYRFRESTGFSWPIIVIIIAILIPAICIFLCITTLKDGAKQYSIVCVLLVVLIAFPLFAVTLPQFSQIYSSHTTLIENCGVYDERAVRFAEKAGVDAYLDLIAEVKDGAVASYDYSYSKASPELLSVSADLAFKDKQAFIAVIEKLTVIEAGADYYGSRVDCDLDVQNCTLRIVIESPAR